MIGLFVCVDVRAKSVARCDVDAVAGIQPSHARAGHARGRRGWCASTHARRPFGHGLWDRPRLDGNDLRTSPPPYLSLSVPSADRGCSQNSRHIACCQPGWAVGLDRITFKDVHVVGMVEVEGYVRKWVPLLEVEMRAAAV